jgi:hypothetical protein
MADKLKERLSELLSTIDYCLSNDRILPGLILLYSSIDIVASLDRPASQPEVQRKDFIAWVDRYLLPGSLLTCSTEDLYAARCGMLHSYSSETKNTRLGKAKEIYYAWGSVSAQQAQQWMLQRIPHSKAMVVHVGELSNAFREGLDRFLKSLAGDPKQAELVTQHAGGYFAHIPKELIRITPDAKAEYKPS